MPTLADLAQAAQELSSEVQGKGVNAADPKEIVAAATKVLMLLDALQPHIGKANTAGISVGEQEKMLTELRNKAQRLIAAYK